MGEAILKFGTRFNASFFSVDSPQGDDLKQSAWLSNFLKKSLGGNAEQDAVYFLVLLNRCLPFDLPLGFHYWTVPA